MVSKTRADGDRSPAATSRWSETSALGTSIRSTRSFWTAATLARSRWRSFFVSTSLRKSRAVNSRVRITKSRRATQAAVPLVGESPPPWPTRAPTRSGPAYDPSRPATNTGMVSLR